MANEISNTPNYLNSIISSSATILSEELFVKRYIPLLFDKDPSVFNLAWINEVAANPHVRVHISNSAGEIIFSVPPLRVSPITNNDPKLTQILDHIQLEINMRGIHGVNILNRELPRLIDVSTKAPEDFAMEWRAILDRYNLSHMYAGTNISNKTSDASTIVDSDDGW